MNTVTSHLGEILEIDQRKYIPGTLIVVAVYINHNERNYPILIKCLAQLRILYKHETIITVDNNSPNTAWHTVARELNMIILHNNSDVHRYEMGAYRLALQQYRADRYICMQGTFYINHELNLSALDVDRPHVIAFSLLTNSWWWGGLDFINSLLGSIGQPAWNDHPILILHSSFCCNESYLMEMWKDGLFDLPSDTKNHSCAFERILGSYAATKLGTLDLEELGDAAYSKTWLQQESPSF